ncbi:MAG: hypothetical protein ACYDH5_11150 [Acidimicrobiales bacterium]
MRARHRSHRPTRGLGARRASVLRRLLALVVVAGLLVGLNFTARSLATRLVADRVARSVPEAGGVTAHISSTWFLFRLLGTGAAGNVSVTLSNLKVPAGSAGPAGMAISKVEISKVVVAQDDVHVSRSELFLHAKVKVFSTGATQTSFYVTGPELSAFVGAPVVISGSTVSVQVGGRAVGAALSIAAGRVYLKVPGLVVPLSWALPRSALFPCTPTAAVVSSALRFSCRFTGTPPLLRAALAG